MPGNWQYNVDLSSPEDASANNGIEKEISVDAVAASIPTLGMGTMLVKMDIKQGASPPTRSLLAWHEVGGKTYIDRSLIGPQPQSSSVTVLADVLV